MTDTTTEIPAAVAPAFPAASIDFNRVHKNASNGATGEDLLTGAIVASPAPAAETTAASGEGDGAKKPSGGKSTAKTDAA
ncbi:hypothetical protein [Sphingomonas sp. NFR15]|uniref:hypothetical protein n=1 Tax=Sphingomonas sp. NFR15 TaxID=1566282 RepID=UPI000886A220|nr:hypothetical protein [Sphingomonas sp. NFR15]SDA14946.1 hypothetical protein SAMN03159340_00617 [Sphingomonas sp. NFR15]